MLLNFSNHSVNQWDKKQISTAKKLYGDIIDLPFPEVDPCGNSEYIEDLARKYLAAILSYRDINAVHIMGEMTFCFYLIKLLQVRGIKCIASTRRKPYNTSSKAFLFETFREYR